MTVLDTTSAGHVLYPPVSRPAAVFRTFPETARGIFPKAGQYDREVNAWTGQAHPIPGRNERCESYDHQVPVVSFRVRNRHPSCTPRVPSIIRLMPAAWIGPIGWW